MYWKLLLKSPKFVPFGAKLAQSEAEYDIPGEDMSHSTVVTWNDEILPGVSTPNR